MAALVAALTLIAFFFAFKFYARFVGERIFDDREEITTPAHEFEDGRDFVPTDKHVLFGHHFTSIAGAAPIVGPCIAAYWGWLPALLWVVLGTIFMGAVHDFGALVMSVREKGRSIADITGKVISNRTRLMFLCFVLVLSWLVLAVFAIIIANLFVSNPGAVLPINIEIIVAIAIGWMIYKKRIPPLVPSLIALAILYLFVWIGSENPIGFESVAGIDAQDFWVIALLVYSAIASLLPVWLLLQPRDFINSHQLIVGLGLIYLGLFITQPSFDAPALNLTGADAPPIFPLLFVTIACGAISGFHALVSSGTTSKQISSLSHARAIGYGSMLGEGALALASVMAAVAGLAFVGTCTLTQGTFANCSWELYYDSWRHAAANTSQAFVLGGGAFIEQLGIPAKVATTLMAVLVISFAATTLDTAMRIERFIVAEIGSALKIKLLQNRYVATLFALVPGIMLAMWNVPKASGAAGETEAAAWVLWPIFGASNQMLAALTLMVLSLYFWKRGKPVLPLILPMLFVMSITLISLFLKLNEFFGASNWFMTAFTALLLSLTLWMILEGIAHAKKIRR